ncbi:MAG: HalX domain-containing protein [Halanaeroarchaeum sp.]
MAEEPTVLVVEDERDLADLYADWLRDAFDVRTAYTAGDAMDEMDETVDVVLLDRRLPETSGDELLERFREGGYDCSVAMVTAVDPDFDIIELGFDDYVVKPIDREGLHGVVDRLLTRSLYNDEVQRYFSLVSKRSTLEATKTPEALSSNDDYQALLDEIDEIETDLDEIVDRLTDDDFRALVQEFSPDA